MMRERPTDWRRSLPSLDSCANVVRLMLALTDSFSREICLVSRNEQILSLDGLPRMQQMRGEGFRSAHASQMATCRRVTDLRLVLSSPYYASRTSQEALLNIHGLRHFRGRRRMWYFLKQFLTSTIPIFSLSVYFKVIVFICISPSIFSTQWSTI